MSYIQNRHTCNDNTLFPVDVLLYDHQKTLTVQEEVFAKRFPNKTVRLLANWKKVLCTKVYINVKLIKLK